MTQSPIEPPNDPRRPDEERRLAATGPSRPLTFDEAVALLVAFLSLGSVLFWGLSRGNMNMFGDTALSNRAPVTSDESDSPQRPFAFGRSDEAVAPAALPESVVGSDEEIAPEATVSAREQLTAQAESRRQRSASRTRMWDDVKSGLAGAAAGVAGVATTADDASAVPEKEATTDTAPEVSDPVPANENTEVPDNVSAASAGAAAPALSAAATATPEEAISFQDVPDNYWAKPYIDALSSRGLISGFEDGTFKPDESVTRAQIANIVSRTFELTQDKENLEFTDVKADYWARESIGEVVVGGFMTGFPDDTFDPNAPVTRAQALTTLVTGLNINAPTNIQAALSRYTDANNIPKWANEKIAAATAGTLVVNYPEPQELQPTEATTRAELSAMIYQALVREGAVEPIESEYVIKP